MDKEEKLKKTIEQLIELMPTILIIGSPQDGIGAYFAGSPEKDPNEREFDLCSTIVHVMEDRKSARDILLGAVCFYFSRNLNDWERTKAAMSQHINKEKVVSDPS